MIIKEYKPKLGKTRIIYSCENCNKEVDITKTDFNRKKTKKCYDCTRKEKSIGIKSKRLYNIYYHMINRCKDKKRRDFKYYGGRGIKVCNEWKNSFLDFQEWSYKNGYSDNLTIDRIDNNGNYEPSNCQWITLSENVAKSNRERVKKHLVD